MVSASSVRLEIPVGANTPQSTSETVLSPLVALVHPLNHMLEKLNEISEAVQRQDDRIRILWDLVCCIPSSSSVTVGQRTFSLCELRQKSVEEVMEMFDQANTSSKSQYTDEQAEENTKGDD